MLRDDSSVGESGTVPLDGVAHPAHREGDEGANELIDIPAQPGNRKRLLLAILLGSGLSLLFYVFFAIYLLSSLPHPEGKGQALQALGNFFYGGISLLSIIGVVLLGLRFLRSGIDPQGVVKALLRPLILTGIIVSIAGMVIFVINQQPTLSIDLIEPIGQKKLVAPVTVTFGTKTLRAILRNQTLVPRSFKWDFDGDGKPDAESQEQEVTTMYKQKGNYSVVLKILLSDGSVRTAVYRLAVPEAVFSVSPETPIQSEKVDFSLENLVSDVESIETISWDFNGDGKADFESKELVSTHAFNEIGTYQVQAIIQHAEGLRETYVRPITILKELKQPFDVSIESEGSTSGSAPLGVILRAKVQDGVLIEKVSWSFTDAISERSSRSNEILLGERISKVFTSPGEYRMTMTVVDTRGRKATASMTISVLEPLVIRDLVFTGTPKPINNRIEGTAPLEVRMKAATETPFITFRWEQEDANKVLSTDDEYRAIYESSGTFPLILIAEDNQGRRQMVPLEVYVQTQKSRILFSAIPSTGMLPLTVTFDASQSVVPDGRITGFSWIFGDGGREEKPQLLGAKVTHKYEVEGTHTVIVRAITEDGRSFEARKTIVVRTPTLDACIFPSRLSGAAPMGVRFDASCSTGEIASYLWDFGDGATSKQTLPVQDHVFEKPGTYAVTLEISDSKGNISHNTVTITSTSPQ